MAKTRVKVVAEDNHTTVRMGLGDDAKIKFSLPQGDVMVCLDGDRISLKVIGKTPYNLFAKRESPKVITVEMQ